MPEPMRRAVLPYAGSLGRNPNNSQDLRAVEMTYDPSMAKKYAIAHICTLMYISHRHG
jgi:hypothetical protein